MREGTGPRHRRSFWTRRRVGTLTLGAALAAGGALIPAAGASRTTPAPSADRPASLSSGATAGPTSPHAAPTTPGGRPPRGADAEPDAATAARALSEATPTDADVALAAAQVKVAAAARAAGHALERATTTAAGLRSARRSQWDAEQRLTQVRAELEAARAAVGRWARDAYMGGSPDLSPGMYLTLSGSRTDDLAQVRAGAAAVGASLTDQVTALKAVERRWQSVSRQVAATTEQARQADRSAGAARATADAQVALARSELDRAETARQSEKERLAAQRRRVSAAWSGVIATSGPGTGASGARCVGSVPAGTENGRLPTSALCPLLGAPGQALRGDAAAAFDRMSAAFTARFGRPLCVTDSYRSLDEQVRVKAARGGWAATPGHSNHGWGIAVDLCGGVEVFSSPEHIWLGLHAPLFGWFHPAWAELAGPLPEPWHWEFGG